MTRELGDEQSIMRVKERFLHHFAAIYGYEDVREQQPGLNIKNQTFEPPDQPGTRNPELGNA
jgi:hypothetical protein